MDSLPDLGPNLVPPTPDSAERRRRQRGRNLVLLYVLIGLAVLFYAISMVKFRVS